MSTRKKAIFSSDGKYFVFLSEHGSLKIWETSTNSIKQEYVLKSPANLIPTALLWGPSKTEITAHDKSNAVAIGHQYLVIGTNDGDIFLYNVDEGKMCFQFASSHEESVNDLCWHPESNCVFSCSSDKSIVIWDIATGMMKSKWETDDGPLYSICMIDSNNLLAASTSISWWDIKERTLIKTFHGHGSNIHTLLSVSSTDYLPSNSYFLSTGDGDSTITAWHLNKSKSKNVVATFDLGDELQNVDVTRTFSKDKPMFLSTVTKGGALLLFKHVLNGRTRKNLVPQMTLHVISKPTGEYSEPSPIPVRASKFSSCSETAIIAYGSLESPIFEKVKIIDCPKTLTLARDKNVFCKKSSDSVLSQVNLYNKLGEYISANGKLPSLNSQYSSPKRKKQKDPYIDMPNTEERITEITSPVTDNKMASNSPNTKKKQRKIDKEVSTPINACTVTDTILSDSHSVVDSLLQCLQTEDRASLHMVLQCKDDDSITSSVASIPSNCLRFILIELHKILISREKRYRHSTRKWLKEILKVHLSYLISSKECVDILDLFKDFIDSKRVAETLMKMSSLRGLLNIHRIQHHTSNDSSDSETEELMES